MFHKIIPEAFFGNQKNEKYMNIRGFGCSSDFPSDVKRHMHVSGLLVCGHMDMDHMDNSHGTAENSKCRLVGRSRLSTVILNFRPSQWRVLLFSTPVVPYFEKKWKMVNPQVDHHTISIVYNNVVLPLEWTILNLLYCTPTIQIWCGTYCYGLQSHNVNMFLDYHTRPVDYTTTGSFLFVVM